LEKLSAKYCQILLFGIATPNYLHYNTYFLDVLDSAKGWAASFLFDSDIKAQLSNFRDRTDTFSFGVCNGCQLLALLQWIGLSSVRNFRPAVEDTESEVPTAPDVFLDHNHSGRYESRFPSVRIEKSPSIMLKEMSGSVLGVWIAHSEGNKGELFI